MRAGLSTHIQTCPSFYQHYLSIWPFGFFFYIITIVVREGLARREPPDKLHRTIKTCLMASSGAARDAMLAALELDLGVRITAIADKKEAPGRKAILTPALPALAGPTRSYASESCYRRSMCMGKRIGT